MRKLYVDCGFQVKQVTDDGRIEGHGAVFGNVDMGFDRIEKGAFRDWIKGNKTLPMLWQHDTGEPIGVWDEIREDSKGLFVGGQLNLSRESGQADVPTAWKARALAKQNAVSGLSIGYGAVDFRFEDEVRVLEKVDLFEVSMATIPMNPEARVTGVKHLTNKEFVRFIRENLGLSREAAEALRAGGLTRLREKMGLTLQEGDPLRDLQEVESKLSQLTDKLRRSRNE